MQATPRPEPGTLQRRALFAGASTVGVLAAVAALLPSTPTQEEQTQAAPKAPPERGGGYALTDHVKQYYQTTRV
ncbi:MAG: formate dehydrogenase [Burkholderiaceae bacterium]|nr:formate dehydrogenase [Burkholderiaceae bacterium]MDP3422752.1 formate dehydrogenase [Burkholderiaceae bacterium]MDZ4161707.1 formate dehydrogenase [Burkholderiales bacterium]